MIKRGICTLCTRRVDPLLLAAQVCCHLRCQNAAEFSPGPDWSLLAWSLHYGDIRAGAAHADHWWWWYIRDMSRVITPPWCNMITLPPHSSHQPRPSLSQKYSPAIPQTIVVWQGWELQNAFNFLTFPIAFVILALAVKIKITLLFMSKRLLWFIFIIIYSCLRQCCPGPLIYLSYMTLGEWRPVQCSLPAGVCRTIHDEPQSL